MQNRLLKFFGSLKLAVVVLSLLAVGMATGTFLESRESSRVAAQVVYRSWWFNGLLALLAINIGAAALTRWPWKRKHVGFVITHAGLIILLGGCSAAFHYGTEGMLELHEGEPPANVVRVEDEALTVIVPETGARTKVPLRIGPSGAIRPNVIQPSKDVRLTLDASLANTHVSQLVEDGGTESNPALQFRLKSELVKQDVTDWLLAASPESSHANIGPAQIDFVMAHDADELQRLTSAPEPAKKPEPELRMTIDGKPFTVPIAGTVDKHVVLGDSGVCAHIGGYWPDFRLDENHKPSTASEEPNNPAAVVVLSRGENEERQFVFASSQMEPIIRTTRGTALGAQVQLTTGKVSPKRTGVMTVILAPDGTLHYAVAAKTGFKSGEMKVGEPVATGWMDFQFTPVKYIAKAVVSERVEPVAVVDPEASLPALKVTAHVGGQEQSAWVRFGEPIALDVAGKTVHIMFSWDSMPLPFRVELEDFEVERDEGSMNVAGWTSKVIFHDDVRGLTQRASISMNHPAWFNGFKFSQASWNPNDLKYTVLQVKKDPSYVTYLTWVGAVLIVSGIALMFWGRGWLQKKGKDDGAIMKDKTRKKAEMVTA
jgi:hypothetical protein